MLGAFIKIVFQWKEILVLNVMEGNVVCEEFVRNVSP